MRSAWGMLWIKKQEKQKQGMKRKGLVVSIVGLAAVFTLAAAIDLDGYNIFDREDGSNLLCRADPYCRRLTPGEVELARETFGDSINYKNIKVFTRRAVSDFVGNSVARMWNHNLYAIHEDVQVPDYSASDSLYVRQTYLHEMTHVWQYENDPKFLESGLFDLLRHDFDYTDLYRYAIDDHKYFNAFNFEQQAVIVETYYGLQQEFQQKTRHLPMRRPKDYTRSFNLETRDECRTLDQYAAVISSSLPRVGLEPKCAMYRPYQIPVTPPASDDLSAPRP
jgi:hypothetical protein